MFDEARRAGRLLMEAFMYRCHPQTRAIVNAVQSGAIGKVRLIRTSFCYRTRVIEGNIRFSRKLAGGAMMDIGCYCVNFSRLIGGAEPTGIHAIGQLHETNVDVSASGVMDFPDGIQAIFGCAMDVQANNVASICGTEGYIEIPVPWKPPVRDAIWILGRSTPPRQDAGNSKATPPIETFKTTADAALYALEADEFALAVLKGNPLPVSEADTLGNMRVLDTIRAQIGVEF
ncbi:MAG TPA: Gfo/Idh/MocA family oxidoreductase [Tepidisphaeraceae bacterium]|nr:Gfo/Idh/MocA family oxidoreductase [Tepidisphaeraceae bacterium]